MFLLTILGDLLRYLLEIDLKERLVQTMIKGIVCDKKVSKLLSVIWRRVYTRTLMDLYQSLEEPNASPGNGSNVLLVKAALYKTS